MPLVTRERHWIHDGALLSVGTFTALPVPAPKAVNTRSAALSLLLAPVWGAGIALLASAVALTGQWLLDRQGVTTSLAALFGGVLFVAVGAWSNRGLHLDGLADTADGFASLRRGRDGLSVMRDPRLGALGVLSLVLVVLVQCVAMAGILQRTRWPEALIVLTAAGILSRAPLAWLVRRGTSAAEDGLGRLVVGTVTGPTAAVVGLLATIVAVAMVATLSPVAAVGAGVAAWVVAIWVRKSGLQRFGAVTGDILGAAVELSLVASVLVIACT